MDLVITPEPHLIPGYTGHCPQFQFRAGKTYGKLSHKLLLDPCTKHAPELIIKPPTRSTLTDYSNQNEMNTLKSRAYFIDPVYQHPIIPGYNGFIPNMASKTGKRFMAAATASVVEHENLMDRLRWERHLLKYHDILESGKGRFDGKLQERMIPRTIYRSPLIPVKPRSQAIKINEYGDEDIKKQPYSKFTIPHFMENDDKEKHIISGYAGHIPMAMTRFGESNKQLTNSALCEFINNYHHRKSDEWCPMEMTSVASSSPNDGQFVIYHRTIGMVPLYAGHVPGKQFSFGCTYGNATIDAKGWLSMHKD